MTRLYEWRDRNTDGAAVTVVDLEKVCLVRVETPPGHAYPRLLVRLSDGHESHDIVPPEAAEHFLDAYRAYLRAAGGG
jgi:hypothetical protein